MEPQIGMRIKRVCNMLRRYIATCSTMNDGDNVTSMQGWIIGYLAHHSDQNVFQRDLEKRFDIRRSTATQILQLMQKNDLIERKAVQGDARLKKIVLTPKAEEIHQKIEKEISKTEKMMENGLTEEEKKQFTVIMDKIYNNLSSFTQE